MAVARSLCDATGAAFDGVAREYDRTNSANPVLVAMRRRVISEIVRHATPGAELLDLGCGPGTDHASMVAAGYRVTAIDLSAAMVGEARKNAAAAGISDRVQVHHWGIHDLASFPDLRFDVVFSNFGPMNCVPDLPDASRQIAARLRRGGLFVASVIGRVCPWELALCAGRRRWARARVRFASGAVEVPLQGRTVWTRYYTPSEFEPHFRSAGMRRVSLRALGLWAPPPYLEAFARRHRRLVAALHRMDDVCGRWPLMRQWGDHFLIVLKKA